MALPTKLTLEIVTPDRALVTEQVDEVELPGAEGYFGVLPGHTPLLASLQVGELWYRIGQEKFYLAVAFGFVEVLPGPRHGARTDRRARPGYRRGSSRSREEACRGAASPAFRRRPTWTSNMPGSR